MNSLTLRGNSVGTSISTINSWGLSGNPVPGSFDHFCSRAGLLTPAQTNLGKVIRYQTSQSVFHLRRIYGIILPSLNSSFGGKVVVVPDNKNCPVTNDPLEKLLFEPEVDPQSVFAWNLRQIPEWAEAILYDGNFGNERQILGREFFWKDTTSTQVYLTEIAGVTITKEGQVLLMFAAAIPGPWTADPMRAYAVGQIFARHTRTKNTIYVEGFAR
jgi:hypothetical protein